MNTSAFFLTAWKSRLGRFIRSTGPLCLQNRSSTLTLWHSGTIHHPKYWWPLSPNAATFATKKEKTKIDQVALPTKTIDSGGATKATAGPSEIVTSESNAWDTMQQWKEEIVTPGGSEHFDEKVPKLFEESNITTVQHLKDWLTDSDWRIQLGKCGVVVDALLKELGKVSFPTRNPRMVPVDYHIADSELSHTADLEALLKRVNETFDWYGPEPRTFVAPYFPIIQSSGMGKTKLLYELSRVLNSKKKRDTTCYLCLSGAIDIGQDDFNLAGNEKNEVFSRRLDFRNVAADNSSSVIEVQARRAAENIMKYLDHRFLSCSTKKLVLLFDEAQILLSSNYDVHAFVFQCIRLWLRQSWSFLCVAVFAGTTSNLANFFPDENLVAMFSSRDLKEEELVKKNQVRKFLASGKHLPPPFFQTTTIGCCLPIQSEIGLTGKPVPLTEYDQAVPYGRPLFAKMAEKNQLENRLDTVLSRMLLSEGEKWDKNQDSCLSILATRVQMGQTSTETASRLVSKGYASLVGFSDKNVARICYYPDPVCAHLAMAMMDKDWKIKVNDSFLHGKSRRWWIQQAADSFSCGLCLPDKGDVGEIFVAIYLLFCGDILRKKMDPTYRCFSVPLKSWVSNLIEPPAEPTDESGEPDTILSTTEPTEHMMLPVCTPSVSFIQVCSNYLRLYKWYEFVMDQDFLKNIYESGTAFFTHATCEDFDIVVPIRYLHNNRICFAPLLISIKAREKYIPGDANFDCNKMETKLLQTGCHRAVALVVIIGSSVNSNDKLRTLETKDIVDLFESTSPENIVIAKVLRVDMNDSFGISRTLIETTSDGEEMSEVLTSHSFVRAHVNVPEPVFVDCSLRGHKSKKREPYVLLSKLKKHLERVPKGKH